MDKAKGQERDELYQQLFALISSRCVNMDLRRPYTLVKYEKMTRENG